jgi:hypothetical protein
MGLDLYRIVAPAHFSQNNPLIWILDLISIENSPDWTQ